MLDGADKIKPCEKDGDTVGRFTILQMAALAASTRSNSYGEPEDNATLIAEFWSTFLSVKIWPWQVGPMMCLLKLARVKSDPKNIDNYVDIAGYGGYSGQVVNVYLQKCGVTE